MKCKVVVREWLNDVEFYFYEDQNHEIYVAEPVSFTFHRHEKGSAIDPKKATFTLDYSKAIELVESVLEEARFAMIGSSQRMRKDDLLEGGELKAMRDHLADMKKLVFTPPEHLKPTSIWHSSGIPSPMTPTAFPNARKFGEQWVAGMVDTVSVRKDRVRRAAKQCSNAKGILAELFPEVFGPGWEYEID